MPLRATAALGLVAKQQERPQGEKGGNRVNQGPLGDLHHVHGRVELLFVFACVRACLVCVYVCTHMYLHVFAACVLYTL